MIEELSVSIVINNYNYEQYLSEAIGSACGQNYSGVEVIVVDDGSVDGSRHIIESYGDSIVPIYKANGGQASAFNAGFAASNGDIVIFLDADDYLLPIAVERIVAAWNPDAVKVHYLLNGVDAAGQHLGYTYPARGEYLGRGNVVPKFLERGVYGVAPTSGNAFSRAVLAEFFPIEEEKYRISADGYLATVIAFYGEIVAVEEVLGGYRVHGNNNWGISTDGSQFRSFIEHDQRKQELLNETATLFGHKAPDDILLRNNTHLRARMASLRLAPHEHPILDDRRFYLLHHGIRSAWLHSDLSWQRRLIVILWFFIVGLVPIQVSKPAISWLFAQESRPKLLNRILNRLRPFLNRD